MTEPQTSSTVLSFSDARHLVEKIAQSLHPGETERVSLLDAGGRVLAESICADRDFPPFARVARDGFAVRAKDVREVPVRLRVGGEIRAGQSVDGITLGAGEAIEIMTGAPAPQGADAVIMVEYTSRSGDSVELQRSIASGENIVPRGSEGQRGQRLLQAGTRMNYAAIAVAASAGHAELAVYRRPKVFVLATGDEIVDISSAPLPHQLRNSNSYSLAAQVAAAGGEPVMMPVAPDEPAGLRELIREGLAGDLLLLSGGVSMGKYDLVESVLAEFDAEFHFTGVLIQPGKPLVFGDAAAADGSRKFFFGLPGNPVSTMVTFELFVRPMLEALCGARPRKLVFPLARLRGTVHSKTGLTRFIPAILGGEFGEPRVELAHWKGSGDVAASARANCYLVIGPEVIELADNDLVPILLRGTEIG